ncbi:MAG: Holliday junction branch migration protein RuvA [Spirochaetes bacterium]|nr:MAG: Holliday junction branch migration protein RuvA [Spirochaetota bacterium]
MISKLRGKIDELKPAEVVIDAGGVGYRCSIPFSTYEKLRGDSEAVLHIYTHHREDQLRLFGFYTQTEKNLFMMLLGIPGIGPAMSLAILSGISIDVLVGAVKANNPGALMRIPGVGKAKAEKLIFELARKAKKIEALTQDVSAPVTARSEAIEALVSLGFDDARASKAVEAAVKENPSADTEHVLKAALKLLA